MLRQSMAASDLNRRTSFTPTVVLYHAECADGFGAAWALWRRFPSADYRPVKHGNPPPDGLRDQRVVIVDFSYGRDQLQAMAEETQALLVLDHHVTAEKALAGPHPGHHGIGTRRNRNRGAVHRGRGCGAGLGMGP